jgi:hypothetical protein
MNGISSMLVTACTDFQDAASHGLQQKQRSFIPCNVLLRSPGKNKASAQVADHAVMQIHKYLL